MKTRFFAFLLITAATGLAAESRNPAVITSEFINEHASYPECHASTIVEVAPGKLVAAWFGGTRERAPDVGIWVARQEGGRWLDAVEVANGLQPDGSRLPTWNPVLFQPKDGPLALFYKVGPSPSIWWGMIMTSVDGGKSWGKPVRLAAGVLGPIKNKPVLLADGTWLCPSSTEGGEDGGDTMTTGDIGFRYLLQALAEGGRSDLIYRMINQDEKPGYGYELKKGETSLTESWDANLNSSHNHFMLGQITECFYKDLAGIDVDPTGPGFKKIILRPQPVGDLTWVEASYESIRGPISVRWERDGERFVLKATIPVNTKATVFLPAREGAAVQEGGALAEQRPGVKFLRREGDRAVFAIESGFYKFESQGDGKRF